MVAPRPYPSRIEHATCRAIDARIAAIRALSLDARFLLVQFVRSVSLKCLSTSVRIRNSTLTAALDCGVKKVCALKTELEAAGWIVREQVKSRARGMQVSDVWLTPWALEVLGLNNGNLEHPAMPVPSEQDLASDSFIPPARATLIPTEKRAFSQEESTPYISTTPSERQPAAAPHVLSEQETSLENQQPTAIAPKAYNNVIPNDLIPLHIAGISVPRIRMLMGMASKVGKRLGHIVEVAETSILQAKNPFHYTVSLISSPTDWAAKRAMLHQEQQTQKRKAKKTNQQADDHTIIAQAMRRTGMVSNSKRIYVWKLDEQGTVRRAAIAQFATTQLVDWMPLADIAAFAEAVRDGKFFAVDMHDVRDMAGIDPLSEDCSAVPLAQAHSDLDNTHLSANDGQEATNHPVQTTKATSPIDAALQALQTAARQSPDGLLASSKHTKVWKIIDGWLKVTTVQELLNTKTAIINWQPLSAEGVIDFAKWLKQGQLFPVDRQTVQSWCPQPQPRPIQPTTMQASTAKVPDQSSGQPTGIKNWHTSLASLFNTCGGQLQDAGG